MYRLLPCESWKNPLFYACSALHTFALLSSSAVNFTRSQSESVLGCLFTPSSESIRLKFAGFAGFGSSTSLIGSSLFLFAGGAQAAGTPPCIWSQIEGYFCRCAASSSFVACLLFAMAGPDDVLDVAGA